MAYAAEDRQEGGRMNTVTELARHERYGWMYDAWACRCGTVLTTRSNEAHDRIVRLWAEHVAATLGLEAAA